MDQMSVRSRQIELAKAMLNPNADLQPDWKFLIYDTVGKDIIESICTTEKLRNYYFTLRLPIDMKRDKVSDVSAVYFVMPTEENVERICLDLTNHLYESYYLNFISRLSRPSLERIANAASISDSSVDVRKIYSQYLDFIALESNLFILKESGKNNISYLEINRNNATEEECNTVIDNIVESLFSLFVTLNRIPIIRCPKGGAAEKVATKLNKKIRENLNSDENLFTVEEKESNSRRLLFCLVNRSFDISTPLHHTWTYQALIHDLLNTNLNAVTLVEDNPRDGRLRSQTFDLDPEDKFWFEQKGNPFPQVAEAVQREFDQNKREGNSKIPKTVKDHVAIAAAVLEDIKSRKLDNFFETEEKIMNRNLIDRVTLNDIITDPEHGNHSDKYRLFLISYICDNPNLSEDEANRYMDLLESLGCRRNAFKYVKKWKASSSVINLRPSLHPSDGAVGGGGGGGGVLKTAHMFSRLMLKGSQFVMEGVKNLVLKEHHLPLTKILDNLMDNGSRRENIEYIYIDPMSQDESKTRYNRQYYEAIAFVIGGGNYIEYQNLVDYCKSSSTLVPRNVIYGSTELMNAVQFLKYLELLGDT